MPGSEYLYLEALIARTHKLIHESWKLADSMQLYGVAHDLDLIDDELVRVQESLLKNPQRKSVFKDHSA